MRKRAKKETPPPAPVRPERPWVIPALIAGLTVLCLALVAVAAAAMYGVASDEAMDVRAFGSQIAANGKLQSDGTSLTYNIAPKSDLCVLPFQNIWGFQFDCQSETAMTIECVAVDENRYQFDQYQAVRQVVTPGTTRCQFDLRQCRAWNAKSRPMLAFFGQGKVVLSNFSVARLQPGADIEAMRDRARFWKPQRIDHATINFMLPTNWSEGRSWPWVLGATFCVVFAVLATASRVLKRLPWIAILTAVSLTFVLVLHSVFMIRFYPTMHKSIVFNTEEKIRRFYEISPGFGDLAVIARAKIPLDAKVLIRAQPSDWFTPRTLAFNLTPRVCAVVPAKEPGKWWLEGGLLEIPQSDINYYVSYYSPDPMPPGFEVVWSQNPSVFIARKK